MGKQWKRYSTVFAVVTILLLMFVGCGKNDVISTPYLDPGESDLEYVQKKGTLVVGITDYAPMDYKDGEKWVGFDADLAEAFAENIGVTVELVEIDWDKKTKLLAEGSIDCIWNGMTMTEDLQGSISCTNPYLSNSQVIVLNRSEMEQYSSVEACQHLLFAVEEGSTGEALLKEMNYRYRTFSTQREALQSVSEKKADAAVIDIIMASYYIEKGQEFSSLGFDILLNDEKICVGFRNESDLKEKADDFLNAAYEDGTISSLAELYGIESAVLEE